MNPASHLTDLSSPPSSTEENLPSSGVNVGRGERYLSFGAGLGLLAIGLARRGVAGWALGALGAALLARGTTGKCSLYKALHTSTAPSTRHGVADNLGVKIERSLWIERPAEELYAFFRDFRNLAPSMKQVTSLEKLDDGLYRWRAVLSHGKEVQWETQLINEHPNELLAWESLPGAEFQNAGSIRFLPEGTGTRVNIVIDYHVPGGLFTALKECWSHDPMSEALEHNLVEIKETLEGRNGG